MQKKLPWETCSVPKSTEGQTATPVIFKAPSMGSRHSRLPWGDHYTGMKYCQRHRCGKGMATCGQSRNCLAEMRGLSEKKIKWLGQRDSDRLADESWDQGIQKSVIQFSIPLWCSTSPKKKKKKIVGPPFSLVQDKRNIIHFPPQVEVARFSWIMFLHSLWETELWSSKLSALKSFLLAIQALRRLFFHLNHTAAKCMHSFLIAQKFHRTGVNWEWKRKWHEAIWQQENNNPRARTPDRKLTNGISWSGPSPSLQSLLRQKLWQVRLPSRSPP